MAVRQPTTRTRESAPPHRGWTLLATSMGFAVVQLDVSVVNVAIRPIGVALGGGVSGLQWVVNAYTITFAALILTAGALGDRIGAKRVFIAGFGLFTVASAACGLAPSLAVLVASRAVQGIGAAILVPCSLTLLNHTYPEARDRAWAVGLWATGGSAALSAGPLVGGVLTETLGWRAIFFINAPIGLAGIAITVRWAAETTRSSNRGIDVPGQLAAIVALSTLAFGLIEGGTRGFTQPAVLASLAVFLASAALFVVLEAVQSRPMLPLGLFRSPTFAGATAVGLLINVAFYGLIFVLSLYFQESQHLTPLTTGLAFAPMTVAVMAANVLSPRVMGRIGARWVIAIGALLAAAGCLALLDLGASTGYDVIVIPFVVLGAGLGLVVPAMTSALLGSVERSRSGVAAGTLNTARQTGSVVGVAVFGSLIVGRPLVSGLHIALGLSIALALAVAALTPLIGRDAPA